MPTLFERFVPTAHPDEEEYFMLEERLDQHEMELYHLERSLRSLTRLLARYRTERPDQTEATPRELSEIRRAFMIHKGSLECVNRKRRAQAAMEDLVVRARLELYGT